MLGCGLMSFCLLVGGLHLEGDVGRRLGAHGVLLLLQLLAAGFNGDADTDLCLLLLRD
jgi:hypothetical protein